MLFCLSDWNTLHSFPNYSPNYKNGELVLLDIKIVDNILHSWEDGELSQFIIGINFKFKPGEVDHGIVHSDYMV